MKNSIYNLWHGSISPAENCGVNNPEIENLVMLLERNREKLEKELARKEKALAEAAALLVLRKKANAIWGTDNEDE